MELQKEFLFVIVKDLEEFVPERKVRRPGFEKDKLIERSMG